MEKVYLRIGNTGEVDVNAFRLLGASSKEDDDSMIGFFGSGLKYAVALLKREGIEFKVFSGQKEVKIGTRKTKMRGEVYEVITINGSPTSMTTRMGKDWELWFALREIYCNALDESDCKIDVHNQMIGEADKTYFYIEFNDELKEIWKNREQYFSYDRNHIYDEEHDSFPVKLFETRHKDKMLVYRKGILVSERKKRSLFDYDFHGIEINESRVIKSDWDLSYKMVNLWRGLKDPEIISRLFGIGVDDTYEFGMDWTSGYTNFSDTWLEAIDDTLILPKEYEGMFIDDLSGKHIALPFTLCQELKRHFGDKVKIRGIDKAGREYTVTEASERQQFLIDEATSFFTKAGITITYPIKVAKFTSASTLGMADGGMILVSERSFAKGRREVVAVVIEEKAHLDSESADRTRGFQDHLIDEYIKVLEEKSGQYL